MDGGWILQKYIFMLIIKSKYERPMCSDVLDPAR